MRHDSLSLSLYIYCIGARQKRNAAFLQVRRGYFCSTLVPVSKYVCTIKAVAVSCCSTFVPVSRHVCTCKLLQSRHSNTESFLRRLLRLLRLY